MVNLGCVLSRLSMLGFGVSLVVILLKWLVLMFWVVVVVCRFVK